MDPNVILPLGSSALSFVFAAMVADQWFRRRQPYQLVWTFGLLWYGISAGTEFWGSAFGWNEPLYRTWYLLGAFGVAAYLGLGTVYLLNRTRFGYFVAVSFALAGLFSFLTSVKYAGDGTPASTENVLGVVGVSIVAAVALAIITRLDRRLIGHVCAGILVAASALVTVLTLTVEVAAPGYAIDAVSGVPTGNAMPADLRILTPPFNIVGAFALVFGAAYSAYIFMPKRRLLRPSGRSLAASVQRAVAVVVNFGASLPLAWRTLRAGMLNSRVPATVLIALGGFIPGWTSGLNRFGITWAFFLGEFVGVVLIFIGFLVSTEVFSDVRLPFTRVVLVRRGRERLARPDDVPTTEATAAAD